MRLTSSSNRMLSCLPVLRKCILIHVPARIVALAVCTCQNELATRVIAGTLVAVHRVNTRSSVLREILDAVRLLNSLNV